MRISDWSSDVCSSDLNALKYAPTGSEVLVKFEEKTDEILIRFDSLGPVIGDKEKNRIFERSYRGEAVRGSSLPGSGIGLFAAKTIVETHFGGKIFVNQIESEIWEIGRANTELKSLMRISYSFI